MNPAAFEGQAVRLPIDTHQDNLEFAVISANGINRQDDTLQPLGLNFLFGYPGLDCSDPDVATRCYECDVSVPAGHNRSGEMAATGFHDWQTDKCKTCHPRSLLRENIGHKKAQLLS